MNSKKAITLLVLATLLMGMIPLVSVNAIGSAGCFDIVDGSGDPTADQDAGVYGDTLAVLGDGVTAGKTVELYWDAVDDWDGETGLLNTSKAGPDGSFEVWFDVPESTGGDHYLWVRDASTGETMQVDCDGATDFVVGLDTDLSANSGLAGYKPDYEAYGLGDDEIAAIMLKTAVYAGATIAAAETLDTSVAATLSYDGTADETPIVPGTFTPSDTVETFTDNGDGTLTGNAGGDGTIDYVTGEWELNFNAMLAANDIDVQYDIYEDDVDDCYIFDPDVTATELGTIEKTLTIPSEATMDKGDYKVALLQGDGTLTELDYTIGAVITVDVDEGPSGTVVEITGKGFDEVTPDQLTDDDVWISDGANTEVCEILDYTAAIDIDADGEFKIEVVIPVPQTGDWEDYDTMVVNPDTGANAGVDITCDFDLTGVAGITITPNYGVQGESITVEGWNFTAISDEIVEIELYTVGDDPLVDASLQLIEEVETDANGHFEETIQIPAISSGEYDVGAHQDDYTIADVDDLRIGMMIVIMSPTSGPTGTKVTLSGTGFTEDETWNATFDGDELFGESTVDSEGNIEDGGNVPTFYVPTMDPGTYTVSVLDIDADIAVEVEFTVTDSTMLELDPVVAPQDYNVSISGKFFADKAAATLEAVIYNETEDWDMLLYQFGGVNPKAAAILEDEGNFSAWWDFNDNNLELDIGEYMINITDNEDLFAQIPFSVVDKTVDIEPRKSTFRIGDTLAFDVESSFAQDDSYIKIYDPSGSLYWQTDKFEDTAPNSVWIMVGTVELVPYYEQVAGGNPMTFLDDAPLGTWTWEWYEPGNDPDILDEGTFEVEAAAADVIGQQVEDLNNQITDLADQLTDVTSEFDDVKSDIADVAAIAEQAVSAAQQAAEAVQTVAQTANTASQAASDAAEAANAARDAANDLTTLVYGAIGAALVAALAAIVSLMQISRRIAG